MNISYNATADRTDQLKTSYLLSRLGDIYRDKDTELLKTFGLTDEDKPKTPKELIERIKAGRFVLPKDADDEDAWEFSSYNNACQAIRWRDPALKEDKESFKKALKALDKSWNDTADDIKIKSPEEGLAALRAFESATFH